MPPYGWMAAMRGNPATIIPAIPLPCPLCLADGPTVTIHGTHRRVCEPCSQNIPLDMHAAAVTP